MTKTRELEEVKAVKVDLTYLCPKDPNHDALRKAAGGETFALVSPDDGPQHLGGYITEIDFKPVKKQTFMPDGRPYEFLHQRKTATWKCGMPKCDGEIKLDPYVV